MTAVSIQQMRMELDANERAREIDRLHQLQVRELNQKLAAANKRADARGLHDNNASKTGRAIYYSDGTTGWRLSSEAAGFLRAEAKRADELSQWAQSCWAWVQAQQRQGQ